MPETTITPDTILHTGTLLTFAACNADGSKFINNGTTWIYVKNGDGSDHTVTVVQQVVCLTGIGSVGDHDVTVTIPAGSERTLGPYPIAYYNDGTQTVTDYCHITFSAVTSMTIAVATMEVI